MNVKNPFGTEVKALACIEEEIATQKLVLSKLYAQKNSFSSIHRLPVEILQSIFIHCARDHHIEDYGHPTLTAPTWVNVSYVCSHWRNTALDCPALWSYPFITSPRWTEELMARSKNASLKAHVNLNRLVRTYRSLRFIRQLGDHAERIKELRLELRGTCIETISKFSSRAPRLEYLKISVDHRCPNLMLSSVPFCGDTPVLRTLELSGCPMPWYLFKLSGLKTLRLHDIPAPFQPNMAKFLDMLGCMQCLRHLYLEDALGCASSFLSSATFRTVQKINLPHLSRLLVSAPISTVVALLSCSVDILSTAELRLECHCDASFSRASSVSLSSLLAQRFSILENLDQTPSNLTIHSLVIECARERQPTILTFSTSERYCNSSREAEWDCDIPLKVLIHFNLYRSHDEERIVSDICRAVPLPNVQSLHIIRPPFHSMFWVFVCTFVYLHNIRYVKLSWGYMPGMEPLLSLSSPYHNLLTLPLGGHPLTQDFLPALDKLELHDFRILAPPSDYLTLSPPARSPEDGSP